jgi:hypothetical protein
MFLYLLTVQSTELTLASAACYMGSLLSLVALRIKPPLPYLG